MPQYLFWLAEPEGEGEHNHLLDIPQMVQVDNGNGCCDVVPRRLYDSIVQDFARTRMIGRAVPCPGCDWDGCVDCNPELEPAEVAEDYDPAHPEWLQPENIAAIHKAIDELEARLGEHFHGSL